MTDRSMHTNEKEGHTNRFEKVLGTMKTHKGDSDEEGLHSYLPYVFYRDGETAVTLDGEFTDEELDAIAWYMRQSRDIDSERVIDMEMSVVSMRVMANTMAHDDVAPGDSITARFGNAQIRIHVKKLTTEQLESMEPGEVIARGRTYDTANKQLGINLANTGNEIKWIAVRGEIADWAIYADNPYTPCSTWDQLRREGDKVHDKKHIRRLVSCDDGALEAYRH